MSRIQINDLNPADLELLALTDEELLAISGGGLFTKIFGAIMIATGAVFAATGVGSGAAVALIAGGVAVMEID